MSIEFNPIQRLCNKSVATSRQITLCRRAYLRTRRNRDKRFWYVWEEKLKEQLVGHAVMLERVLTLKSKVLS